MKPILDIQELTVQFRSESGEWLTAIDRLNLRIEQGETFGLVGESGCGKSVTALSILRLLPNGIGTIAGGRILYDGTDIVGLSESEMRRIRGREIAMIFQEPMTSLNPVLSVGFQLMETLKRHRDMSSAAARTEAADLLRLVGIPEPQARLSDYPHQMSGGMRQRVMIAMALSCKPRIMIADEPTTALDVTIQAQILDLIQRLQGQFGMSVLLITHDLGVIAETCSRAAVMYMGRIVESASVSELFAAPMHPYTIGLFRALPNKGKRGTPLEPIPGTVPDLAHVTSGCAFQQRCLQVEDRCGEAPPWVDVRSGHGVRCWLAAPKGLET